MLLRPTYTINELITRCKAGERKAQEMLYKQFASGMLGVCMRYATDKMEAEDMLQNGFIKIFKKLDDYRGEGSFEGWVRRIMVHSAIEYYRKHHKMIQVMDVNEMGNEPSVNPAAMANMGVKDLMGIIQQLSPGYKMVFNLYAIEGYSHKEIAEMVGITEGASKSQLSRARAILKGLVLKMNDKKYEYAG
ncbi:RNA polymerase sigma factor [Mucilaginibacter sp. UR6-11]|uniref:RNA polymerase sigma factor n=1 Tax=Mucilaginibacter sp. UR6-11 TaxID=1435644 RepID=UPI001E474B54|nr:sigma-70 family RNA polymerase sigma factor [Mucilaginibacter sp. UR6-11]MCC8424208.1 sigma-70 family RNA polymerase sigma factor [Mucilaginibacter sp. UR6-11]